MPQIKLEFKRLCKPKPRKLLPDCARLHRLFGTQKRQMLSALLLSEPPPSQGRDSYSFRVHGSECEASLILRGFKITPLQKPKVEEEEEEEEEFFLEFSILPWDDGPLACGLRSSEVIELMLRDITPADYDTLLRLDENNAKKTVDVGKIEQFTVSEEQTCGICLATMETGAKAKRLNCGHVFHAECIDEWLGKRSDKCPLDNQTMSLLCWFCN